MSRETLRTMHEQLLEALRHREQEIFRYLAILVPALGGFVWLIYQNVDLFLFTVGTVGVLLLLLLGAVYSLALGYNYRYITLQLAKIESKLGINESTLVDWPKTSEKFLERYKLCGIPWCTPPEIIKVFWIAFQLGILGVMIVAFIHIMSCLHIYHITIIIITGIMCLLIGILLPICYGNKLKKLSEAEPKDWNTPNF